MRSSKAFLFLVMFAMGGAVLADTRTWSGLPDSSLWSDGNNWNGGNVPDPGDDLVFSISYFIPPMVDDLAAGIVIRSITFEANGYTLVGNGIVLRSAGCTHGGATGVNTMALPIQVSGELDLSAAWGCALVVSGPIAGDGALVAMGTGPVILSGEHSYTGVTKTGPSGGVLVVNGTLPDTSGVEVRPSFGSATLGGRGSFPAPLTVGALFPGASAAVAPGDVSAPGILVTGSATFGLNASVIVRLEGTTAGTQYDQLRVVGPIDLGVETKLQIGSLGFVPPLGAAFTIVRNDGLAPISGSFVGLPEGAAFQYGTTRFQVSYVGGDGNDVVLTVVPVLGVAAAVAVDPEGNGVLEPGELATLQPIWTNVGGASIHFSGVTAGFTGPIGAVYSNPDATGDYGTVADGASASCTDCYAVQATPVSSRPAAHWDATIEETLLPGSAAQTWTLHIGDSFTDVPVSHAFYAFIENLFHHGVTAGCGQRLFCPEDVVTRAQMAVFLLKSEHGSSYVPPVCSSTLFADEPCPGGYFVDWVNRLASEEITAGCGGGNYCPSDPIDRGQMAVFLLKGEHGGDYVPPACAATLFDDVPCPGARFVDWINQLVLEAITAGCGGGDYCSGDPVDRGQMAVLLVRTFGLLLYGT